MKTRELLSEKEIEELKTVGVIAENWYAVTYNKNSKPFAIFHTKDYAEAYKDRYCATAIVEPWPMIIKDVRKGALAKLNI